MEAVSASTRIPPEVPSLALTTKVVPLLTSTIGGARMPGFVAPLRPTTRDFTAPVATLIWYRVPFWLPTMSRPRFLSRTGPDGRRLVLTVTGHGAPPSVGVPLNTPL